MVENKNEIQQNVEYELYFGIEWNETEWKYIILHAMIELNKMKINRTELKIRSQRVHITEWQNRIEDNRITMKLSHELYENIESNTKRD